MQVLYKCYTSVIYNLLLMEAKLANHDCQFKLEPVTSLKFCPNKLFMFGRQKKELIKIW